MKYPIAIIDYGIGGLGLYNLIRKDFPKIPLLYFSDSGEVPYGKLSKSVLRARIEKVFKFLENQGAAKIIVACHSASSVVLPTDKNAIGLRSQTLKAVARQKSKSIGIIGGGRTIRAGFYQRELKKLGIKTSQRIAQPLSILVERGEIDTKAVHDTIYKIMKPLKNCDSILLACTHYPVLSEVISEYTEANLIDPVDELYKSIYQSLCKIKTKGDTFFMTTGNIRLMKAAARKAFDVKIDKAKQVVIR